MSENLGAQYSKRPTTEVVVKDTHWLSRMHIQCKLFTITVETS